MSYQSKHLVTLFKIAPETLRQWTLEFKKYLSPTANPGANKQRFYIVEDVQVLGLVSEQKNAGFTYEEIHASLENGSRIDPPNLTPDEMAEIVGSDEGNQLAIQVSQLQHKLALSQDALNKAEVRLAEMKTLQEEKIRLEVELKSADKYHGAEVSRLQTTIDRLNDQMQQLTGQAGETYAKGFQEGWKLRGNNDD
jgi:DNA-binding transcriptional MerR regulator